MTLAEGEETAHFRLSVRRGAMSASLTVHGVDNADAADALPRASRHRA
jgi:hypothetical protein